MLLLLLLLLLLLHAPTTTFVAAVVVAAIAVAAGFVSYCYFYPHMGTDFFPAGGKNASKSEIPPKIALGEG